MSFEKIETVFFNVLDDLKDYLNDLTIIGGWQESLLVCSKSSLVSIQRALTRSKRFAVTMLLVGKSR